MWTYLIKITFSYVRHVILENYQVGVVGIITSNHASIYRTSLLEEEIRPAFSLIHTMWNVNFLESYFMIWTIVIRWNKHQLNEKRLGRQRRILQANFEISILYWNKILAQRNSKELLFNFPFFSNADIFLIFNFEKIIRGQKKKTKENFLRLQTPASPYSSQLYLISNTILHRILLGPKASQTFATAPRSQSRMRSPLPAFHVPRSLWRIADIDYIFRVKRTSNIGNLRYK